MHLALSTAEDDVYDVNEALITMAGSWNRIAVSLRLPPHLIRVITKQHSNNPNDCLLAVVEEWLKGVYNVQEHGHPSWRGLVQAVANPAGGANPALARSIAAKHPGNHHSMTYVSEYPVVSYLLVSLVTSAPGRESLSDADTSVQTTHQAHSKRIMHYCMCAHTTTTTFSLCNSVVYLLSLTY